MVHAHTHAGADLYALCADAWMVAFKRRVAEIEANRAASSLGSQKQGTSSTAQRMQEAHGEQEVLAGSQSQQQDPVVVTAGDMELALQQLVPSLSVEEIAKYERLRDRYET